MSKFEIVVQRGRDAERITTAFYRFLELQTVSATDTASLQTEILGDQERRIVELWSDDAVRAFERFLQSFRLDPPSGLVTSQAAWRRRA